MQETYNKVPNIVSSKDLDYLSDMFNWNYGAYKSSLNASNSVTDESLSNLLKSNKFELAKKASININTKDINILDNSIVDVINKSKKNNNKILIK